MAQFARRVLNPGAWTLLFCSSFYYFTDWRLAFEKCGFVGPQYPFVIMKNTADLQEHRGEYSQNACELEMIMKTPGLIRMGSLQICAVPTARFLSRRRENLPGCPMYQ